MWPLSGPPAAASQPCCGCFWVLKNRPAAVFTAVDLIWKVSISGKSESKWGVVLQDSQLIPGDILSNIAGSKKELSEEDVWELLKKVGMDEEIREMPMGLKTMVAEGAGTLSGGQRQKLLIAKSHCCQSGDHLF